MSNFAQQAHSSTANFLVGRGIAVRIVASSLNAEHVGRALMNEVWRDHEWLYISAITTDGDQVTIEYLTSEKKPAVKSSVPLDVEGKIGTVTSEVTDTIVSRRTYTTSLDSEIVITPAACQRPVGSKVTVVTTRESSEEPLDDVIAQ